MIVWWWWLWACEGGVSSIPELPFLPTVEIPPPEVTHDHRDRRVNFPVEGRTLREIQESIAKVLRLANVDRTGTVRGSVRPTLDVEVKTEWVPRGCAVREVTITTEALVFVPEWKTDVPRLRERWSAIQERIATHEERHRDITYQVGHDLAQQLPTVLAPAPTCDILRERVDVMLQIALDKHEYLQAEHDRVDGFISF